jgi:hypothetical protein
MFFMILFEWWIGYPIKINAPKRDNTTIIPQNQIYTKHRLKNFETIGLDLSCADASISKIELIM